MYWLSLPRLNPKRRELLSPTAKGAARGPLPLKSPGAPSGRRPEMLRAAPPVPPQPSKMLPVASEQPSRMAKDVAQVQQPLRPAEARSGRLLEMLQAGPPVQPLNGIDRPVADRAEITV